MDLSVPTYSIVVCHPILEWTTVAVAETEQQARDALEVWRSRLGSACVMQLRHKTGPGSHSVLVEFLPNDWREVGRASAALIRRVRRH